MHEFSWMYTYTLQMLFVGLEKFGFTHRSVGHTHTCTHTHTQSQMSLLILYPRIGYRPAVANWGPFHGAIAVPSVTVSYTHLTLPTILRV